MIYLLIANILSFTGNTFATLSSIFKNKRTMLLMQNTNHILSSISEIMQHAYSGVVQEITSLTRNIILMCLKTYKQYIKNIITITLVTISVIISIYINVYYNSNVWYGYLPILATVVYSACMIYGYSIKNLILSSIIVKIGLILNNSLWCMYGIFIKLYPITVFTSLTIILSIISIVSLLKIKK